MFDSLSLIRKCMCEQYLSRRSAAPSVARVTPAVYREWGGTMPPPSPVLSPFHSAIALNKLKTLSDRGLYTIYGYIYGCSGCMYGQGARIFITIGGREKRNRVKERQMNAYFPEYYPRCVFFCNPIFALRFGIRENAVYRLPYPVRGKCGEAAVINWDSPLVEIWCGYRNKGYF